MLLALAVGLLPSVHAPRRPLPAVAQESAEALSWLSWRVLLLLVLSVLALGLVLALLRVENPVRARFGVPVALLPCAQPACHGQTLALAQPQPLAAS